MFKKLSIICFSLIFIFVMTNIILAASLTSYKFRIFNSPDQRQVAYNIAQAQHEMSLEKDEIARFVSALEGRIMGEITADIVRKMMSEEGFGEDAYYNTDNLEIIVTEDDNGVVTIYVYNKVTGESTEIEYDTGEWPEFTDF